MKAIAAKTREEDGECVLLFNTPCEERREKLTSCSQFQDVVNHFLMQGEGRGKDVLHHFEASRKENIYLLALSTKD